MVEILGKQLSECKSVAHPNLKSKLSRLLLTESKQTVVESTKTRGEQAGSTGHRFLCLECQIQQL